MIEDDVAEDERPALPGLRTAPTVEDRERAADSRLVRRVRWRLVLFSGGATLLVLLLLGAAIYTAVAGSLASTGESLLQARADQIIDRLQDLERRQPPLDLTFASSGTFGYVIPSDGRTIGPSVNGLPDANSVAEARRAGRDLRLLTVTTPSVTTGPEEHVPVRILSVTQPGLPGDSVVQVIQIRAAEQQTLDTLMLVLVVGGFLALVLASMLGATYASRALVPIRASLTARRDALRRQREFAADASHELRTPLTIVRASVEHLQRHADEPVARVGTALTDIDAEVGHLSSLVDDLLLLARSDSGALDITLQPVELGDVAADAASAMTAPASDRGVHVEVDPEPAMVEGDPVRLRQLVTILLDNAVRHSPDGGAVGVRVRRDGRAAILVVEDQGPGIKPEDLAHVFDRFWRASGAPGGGTGLGLAIAATIVTRLDGRIGVANRPGGGAAFTVVLPLLPAARSA